jgi:ABC-type uncharacterized transport system permease subunit
MGNTFVFGLSALISLAPVTIVAYRRNPGPDGLFWLTCLVALAGPLTLVTVLFSETWQTDLSASLWLTVTVSMALFTGLCIVQRGAWRLTPLFGPYLLILGLFAVASSHAPSHMVLPGVESWWVKSHILVSLTTYALLTLAAIAGLSVLLQERALRTRRRTRLTGLLPSIVDAETLQVRLLSLTEIGLGAGLATGAASQLLITGTPIEFDHKTVFAISAFLVIGALLIAHYRTGVRGRRAARLALLAYLLITLGYLGVKFVSEILIH